jgi:hypothetical protein
VEILDVLFRRSRAFDEQASYCRVLVEEAEMFRMIWFLVLIATAAEADSEDAVYTNDRLGYSIRYPASQLKPVGGSNDGQAFAAVSGNAGFRVFAAPLAGRSPQQIAKEAQKICPAQPDYRVIKPTLVAVSCETGDHIVYQKSLLRGGLQITVRGEYPIRERDRWDPVVTSIARSMSVSGSD